MQVKPESIASLFSADVNRQARQLQAGGHVFDLTMSNSDANLVISATVADDQHAERVSLTIEASSGKIMGQCTCYEEPCVHIAALLYQIAADDLLGSQVQNAAEQHLMHLLHSRTVTELRAVAARHQWPLKGTRKDDIVEQVAGYMVAASQDGTWLASLSPNQAELLAAIHLVFDANYGVLSSQIGWLWQKVLGKRGSSAWVNVLDGLVSYGALTVVEMEDGDYDDVLYRALVPIHTFMIPATAWKLNKRRERHLRGTKSVPTPPDLLSQVLQFGQFVSSGVALARARSESAELDPFSHADDWPILPSDADLLSQQAPWFYIYNRQQVALPIEQWTLDDASLNTLATLLGDRAQADWLFQLFLTVGIVEAQGPTALAYGDNRWQIFVEAPPMTQLVTLWTAWRTTHGGLVELRQLLRQDQQWTLWRVVQPDITYGDFLYDFTIARQTVLRFLAHLCAGQPDDGDVWFGVSDLLKAIESLRGDLFSTATGPEMWGFARRGNTIEAQKSKYWRKTYGALVEHMLRGPLLWFGALELKQVNNQIVAFRVTARGRWLLNPEGAMPSTTGVSAEPTVATWRDDATLVLQPGHDLGAILGIINRYMRLSPAQTNTYVIDNAKIEAALQNGERVAPIAQAFADIRAPMSKGTRQHLATLEKQYGQVHVYDGLTIIEFSDDYALAELRSAKILTDDAIIHEFSPRLIVIDDDDVTRVVTALQRRQYTPRVIEQASGTATT